MAKVSEVVAILKKQSDLIGKLRSENADLLEALKLALSLIGGKNVFGDEAFGTETEMIRAAIERNS